MQASASQAGWAKLQTGWQTCLLLIEVGIKNVEMACPWPSMQPLCVRSSTTVFHKPRGFPWVLWNFFHKRHVQRAVFVETSSKWDGGNGESLFIPPSSPLLFLQHLPCQRNWLQSHLSSLCNGYLRQAPQIQEDTNM